MATRATGSLAETLGEYVAGFDLRSSPMRDALMEKAKMHILDGIGVGLAASIMEDGYAPKLMEMVRGFGSSSDCTIIGFQDRAAPPIAAFMNGSLIHGCEFDDAYYERIVHTEPFAVPTALAVAERQALDGWSVMEGWLIAAEVAIRLARGCNDSATAGDSGSLNSSGFHTTSIFGTIGSAASAAKLLGLDASQIATAMSLAVSFASGTTEGWNDESGRNKSIQPGWAAMSGIMAAQMAQAGYECSHSTLDGRNGLYAHSWKNGWSTEPVVEDLGDTWKCLDIAFKVYPAGARQQAVVDCARELVFEHDIKVDEVLGVEITVPSQYGYWLSDPSNVAGMYRPESGYAMHGSFVCNVARMIMSREIGLQHLTLAQVTEPAFLELVDKVTCKAGTRSDYPTTERPSTVAIETKRGKFERTRQRSTGYPDEFRRDLIVDKFHRNAKLVLNDRQAAALGDVILSLDKSGGACDIASLMAC